jgi:hypothetical protein
MMAAWLTTLLFMDKEDQLVIASALLKHNATEAVQLFNGVLAGHDPDPAAFVAERGHSLVSLPTPLWPRGQAFAALRLSQFAHTVPTGGAGFQVLPRGFIGQPFTCGSGFGGSMSAVGGATATTTISTDDVRLRRLEERLRSLERSAAPPASTASKNSTAPPAKRSAPRGGETVLVDPPAPPPTAPGSSGMPQGFRPVPQH